MAKNQLATPILFVAFNRPETTEKVFEEIKKARPKKLFISVDGPRNNEEKEKVNEVKKIFSDIDWPCKIKKRFNKKNKGSFGGPVEAINWFFQNVEEGIILEDDCVPNQDFFRFCSELLEKYRGDQRIMHITGNNFQRGWKRDNHSYYFSKYPYMWGWATWKKSWKKFDKDMKLYPLIKAKKYFSDLFPNKLEENYIKHILDSTFYGKNPTGWDNNWVLSILINNGLSIVPNKNLVQNIGFSEKATRTKLIDSYSSLPTEKIEFPLKHPPFIIRNRKADERYVKWLLKNKIKKHFLLRTGLYRFFRR